MEYDFNISIYYIAAICSCSNLSRVYSSSDGIEIFEVIRERGMWGDNERRRERRKEEKKGGKQ